MNGQNFQQVVQYAINLLQREMLPAFTYHNMDHTLEVVRACNRLAAMEGIDEEKRHLLLIAAYFHDTGLTAITSTDAGAFNAGRAVHEEKAVQIVRTILPTFDLKTEEIETIARLIMATKRDHRPVDVLEQIIADADISPIGQATSSFMRSNEALLKELRSFGIQIRNDEWYENQKEFIEACVYHTSAARDLFDKNRLRNMVAIESQMKPSTSR
jgi:predicted metal-dependent HD superfamily phosphohydrolase